MAVFEWDNREQGRGGPIELLSAFRGLIVAGVIVGPVILGTGLGWVFTLTVNQETQANAGLSASRVSITEDEVRAVGLSPRAVAGILRISN